MTKKIILLYFLIAFCVSCISEKSSQELLINESEECFFKHPSQMYLANDSILLVLDRMQLYELNTYNGNLTLYNTENLKLMYESKYNLIQKKNNLQSLDQIVDDGFCSKINIVSLSQNPSFLLLSTYATCVPNERNSKLVPVSIFTEGTNLDFIYEQDSTLSRGILIGNVPSYLSDEFILSPQVQYFDDRVFPDSIPCIYVYNKRDNGYFFEDSIYVPYKQLENNLIQDESDRYYSYLPNALFFEEGNKVFISTGCTIYELIGKHSLKKLVDTESKIKNFVKNNNEFVLVVKDSTDNYYVEKYNAETGLEINRRELLLGNKYYTSCFDGNSLYVIYMNEEKFYLHEEEI